METMGRNGAAEFERAEELERVHGAIMEALGHSSIPAAYRDDAVQIAWVAYLESRKRGAALRDLSAWFSVVLVRSKWRERRQRSRAKSLEEQQTHSPELAAFDDSEVPEWALWDSWLTLRPRLRERWRGKRQELFDATEGNPNWHELERRTGRARRDLRRAIGTLKGELRRKPEPPPLPIHWTETH